MPISDLCTNNLISVKDDDSIAFAAQIMKKNSVGGLVVVDSKNNKNPVGIITDRDIAMNSVADSIPATANVAQIMTKNIVKIGKNEGIASTVDKMEQEGVRRILVVDGFDSPCGIVSTDDILQLVARELYSLGKLVDRQVKNEKSASNHTKQLIA